MPKNLKIPVLLLGVQNDPIVGNDGVAAGRRDHHQRGRRQQAGDLAGHRARRQHLLGVRAAAGHRLPGQRQPAADRHVLPGLTRPLAPVGVRCAGGGTRLRSVPACSVFCRRLPTPHLPAQHGNGAAIDRCGRSPSCRSCTAVTSWPSTATSPTTSGRSTARSVNFKARLGHLQRALQLRRPALPVPAERHAADGAVRLSCP